MSVETSTTPNLDHLKEQVNALKGLLDDPHPGLFSWFAMYSERMQAISNFWNADESTSLQQRNFKKL